MTAVEYLLDQIENDQLMNALTPKEWLAVFEIAKAKEKAQHQFTWDESKEAVDSFEQYYSQTFKKD
jgi:hypothetical protein